MVYAYTPSATFLNFSIFNKVGMLKFVSGPGLTMSKTGGERSTDSHLSNQYHAAYSRYVDQR